MISVVKYRFICHSITSLLYSLVRKHSFWWLQLCMCSRGAQIKKIIGLMLPKLLWAIFRSLSSTSSWITCSDLQWFAELLSNLDRAWESMVIAWLKKLIFLFLRPKRKTKRLKKYAVKIRVRVRTPNVQSCVAAVFLSDEMQL